MYWCPKQNSPKGRSERENHFFHFKPLCPLSAHRFLSWFREVKMESEDSFSDLIKMAKKLESDILAKINFSSAHVIDLDRLLCDTFIRQCPTPLDYDNRRDLVHIFNTMTKEIYGNGDGSPVVEEYGSFVMDMFDGKSDIDLSLNFNNSIEVSRQKKISALYRFNKKLQSIQSKGHVTGLQLIFSARVPIIKVTDSGTGIECDLSVDNRDGINKSHIIRAISDIDERFRKLCFLMKSWAKVHDINSPKDSTLSSFSIVSFVAFHLQTRNPPILPPFSILLKEGDNPAYVAKVVETYFNYGKQNKESLAMLFITLLVKLASVENLWQKGFCASLYEGSWILKSWKCSYSMSVEDFIDRSQNVARAVRKKELNSIYGCIHKSLDYLMQFRNGQIQGNNLMDVLFEKNTASTLEVGVTSHIVQNKNNLPILGNPHPPKKRRLEENQVRIPSGKKIVQGLQGTGPPQSAGWMQQALDESVRNVLTSATSTISYQPISSVTSPVSYQLPVPISSTNVKVNPGTTSHFSLNAGAFGHPYNPPSIKPHVAPQTSQDFFATVSKKVLAPCPCLPSINSHLHQNPPSIQPRVAHQTSQDFLATVSQKVLTPSSYLSSINFHLHQNPPSIQPHVAPQPSLDFLATVSQKVLAPSSYLPSINSYFPQVGHNPYREKAFYNHRR